MNLKFVQIVQDCLELSEEELKLLIVVLYEQVQENINSGWRKRQLAERISKEVLNDRTTETGV
jgi:hypothetical protein